MKARTLVHVTNVAFVAIVGMAAGHLLMPARIETGFAARAAFALTLALAGGIAGWREHRALAEWRGTIVHRRPLWVATGVAASVLAAALAWQIVHR